MGVAAELIADLRAGAERVDAGAFTVDPHAARRKLDEFRYANRDLYLCQIVEGLCTLGARELDVRTELADVIVEADATGLERALSGFRELYAMIFATDGSRRAFALGRLGIGVNMALGYDDIEAIAFELGDGNVTIAAIFEPASDTPFVGRVETRPARTRVFIDRSSKADSSERRSARPRADLWKLRSAARYSDRRVTILGEDVAAGLPPLQIEREIEAERFRGKVGFDGRQAAPHLHVLSAGVLVDSIPQPSWRPHTVAFVELDGARRDLSQAAIARDASYEAAVAAAQASEEQRLHELWMQWRMWRKHGYPPGFAWPQVRAALNTDGRFDDEHEG
jgi:hypothetical protein